MQGRLVLLRRILRVLPVFHLMALDLNKDSFKCLEGICREFLWGPGDNGNPRVPLVAWDMTVQVVGDGGLGILGFSAHTSLLKLRCVAQVVFGANTAWVAMVGILIGDSLNSGVHKKERRSWTPTEALLLWAQVNTSFGTVNCILCSWNLVAGKTLFNPTVDRLSPQLSMLQILERMEITGYEEDLNWSEVVAYTRARKLFVAVDFWSGES